MGPGPPRAEAERPRLRPVRRRRADVDATDGDPHADSRRRRSARAADGPRRRTLGCVLRAVQHVRSRCRRGPQPDRPRDQRRSRRDVAPHLDAPVRGSRHQRRGGLGRAACRRAPGRNVLGDGSRDRRRPPDSVRAVAGPRSNLDANRIDGNHRPGHRPRANARPRRPDGLQPARGTRPGCLARGGRSDRRRFRDAPPGPGVARRAGHPSRRRQRPRRVDRFRVRRAVGCAPAGRRRVRYPVVRPAVGSRNPICANQELRAPRHPTITRGVR